MLAERGNPIAKRVIDDAVEALAFAIGAAANLLNPKRVILGGGVAEAPEALLLQPLRERLHQKCLHRNPVGHGRLLSLPPPTGKQNCQGCQALASRWGGNKTHLP